MTSATILHDQWSYVRDPKWHVLLLMHSANNDPCPYRYRDAEMKLFEEALDTKAQAQAKIIVDQFFTKPRKKEEWDQIAAINDKVSTYVWRGNFAVVINPIRYRACQVMKSKRGRPIYSPLHKFSNKELVALELAQDDIVTNAAQKKRHLSNLLPKKKRKSLVFFLVNSAVADT